jgi:hypothetical protein
MRLVHNERPATAANGDGALKLSVVGNPKDSSNSLRAQHRAWGLPSDDQIRWFLSHGVSAEALASELVAATPVRFDARFFIPDPDGEKALIFRAVDRDEVIDLIAWSPHSKKIGSFLGVAFCLGDQDQLYNPASWFSGGGLHVHEFPLEWLQGSRCGVVIVDPNQTYSMLRHVPRLVFSDANFARQVKEWVQPPHLQCELLIVRAAA